MMADSAYSSLVPSLSSAVRSQKEKPIEVLSPDGYNLNMDKMKYIYWQDEGMWLGYLEEYPDYMTQGESIEELEANLKDIYKELTSGNIPCIRKVAELQVS
jgi:hypothetical protein